MKAANPEQQITDCSSSFWRGSLKGILARALRRRMGRQIKRGEKRASFSGRPGLVGRMMAGDLDFLTSRERARKTGGGETRGVNGGKKLLQFVGHVSGRKMMHEFAV